MQSYRCMVEPLPVKFFSPKFFPKVAATITNRKWENGLKYRFRPYCQRQQRPSTETLFILVLEKNNVFITKGGAIHWCTAGILKRRRVQKKKLQ
jgi:hypothetical protein